MHDDLEVASTWPTRDHHHHPRSPAYITRERIARAPKLSAVRHRRRG